MYYILIYTLTLSLTDVSFSISFSLSYSLIHTPVYISSYLPTHTIFLPTFVYIYVLISPCHVCILPASRFYYECILSPLLVCHIPVIPYSHVLYVSMPVPISISPSHSLPSLSLSLSLLPTNNVLYLCTWPSLRSLSFLGCPEEPGCEPRRDLRATARAYNTHPHNHRNTWRPALTARNLANLSIKWRR